MRLLHVVPAYHPAVGGAGIFVRAVSERLAARGHQVTVFTRRVGTPLGRGVDPGLPRMDMLNGVAIRRFDPVAFVPRALGTLRRLPGGYRALRTVFRRETMDIAGVGPWLPRAVWAALRWKPDLVTVTNWYYGILVWQFLLLKRCSSIRVVGLPLFHTADAWAHSPVYPRLVAASDAMLANTDHERHFIETLVATPPPVHTVGAGVDADDFSSASGAEVRRRWQLGSAPVVAYVGRMQPQKGVTRLVEAMPLVWAEVPDARLLLAGPRLPGESREDRAVRDALAALPGARRPQVIELGAFADREKASIFDACDVFAMPSTSESFGIVFLEAWMRGKPVIGARIGAVASVIDDGADGLLVPPDGVRALAEAIVALLRDPERRAAMGEAGRRKTLERYTWQRITDRLEGAYAAVLDRGRGPGARRP